MGELVVQCESMRDRGKKESGSESNGFPILKREVKCFSLPLIDYEYRLGDSTFPSSVSLDRGLSRIAVCLPPQHAHRSASAAARVLACRDIEGSSRRRVVRVSRSPPTVLPHFSSVPNITDF